MEEKNEKIDDWLEAEKCQKLLETNIKKYITSNKFKIGKALNQKGLNDVETVLKEFERMEDKKSYLSASQRAFLYNVIYETVLGYKRKEQEKKANVMTGINKESLLDKKI